MTTELMAPPQPLPQVRTKREICDPTVEQLISHARSAPASSGGAWLLSLVSGVLLWMSFTPLDRGPLAWIALVPLILLVRVPRRTAWMYTAVYVCGLAYNIATLQWMRLGDATMYKAWIALSIYIAAYFPLFVAAARVAVHRFSVPLVLAVPVVWVGFEFVRAHFLTGFAWYYLGHTQYWWPELIQISDVTGVYGVSFVLALTSACIAGLLPLSVFRKLKLLPQHSSRTAAAELPVQPSLRRQACALIACLAVFGAVLAYGYVRRAQAEFREGPRLGLVQGNFTSSVKHDPAASSSILQTHHALTGLAVREQADLIVWPETMYRWPLFVASPNFSDDDLRRVAPTVPVDAWRYPEGASNLQSISQMAGVPLIIGLDTLVADEAGFRHYNSAALIRPETGVSGRYDKLHRIAFGEYIPFKDWFPWLYRFTPFSSDFGLSAGARPAVFDAGGGRFAPIICYEDTVPHLVRDIVNSARSSEAGGVDCLVNLTNDGWFHGSSELDQHLITAMFRSVETRTPMVRAVNTGISAIIDGDGVVVEPDVFIDADDKGRDSMRDPQTGRWHKQLNAVLVDNVPLDNRQSLYLAYGDWFAGACCFCTIFLLMIGAILRKRPLAVGMRS